MDTDASATRRRLLAALATVGIGTFGGCVRTGLTMRTDGVDGSEVFESVSLSESWTANKAVGTVTLTEDAATDASVRELAVIGSDGEDAWNGQLQPGQTSVTDARFPVGETAALVAANGSGTYVDSVTVTVGGSSFP